MNGMEPATVLDCLEKEASLLSSLITQNLDDEKLDSFLNKNKKILKEQFNDLISKIKSKGGTNSIVINRSNEMLKEAKTGEELKAEQK